MTVQTAASPARAPHPAGEGAGMHEGSHRQPCFVATGRDGRHVVGAPGPGAPCQRCLEQRLASVGRIVAPNEAMAAALGAFGQHPKATGRPGMVLTVLDEPERNHIALPLPDCDCAGEPAGANDGTWPMQLAMSDWVGPVRQIWQVPSEVDGLHVFVSKCCEMSVFNLGSGFADGLGVSFDRDKAINAALGETIERYTATWPVKQSLLATERDLAGSRIRPARTSFDHDTDRDVPVRWVSATSITDGSDCMVAAAEAYLAYRPGPDERQSRRWTSAGLAAGPTLDWAIEKALLERIERDAFMRSWRFGGPFERLPAPPVPVSGLTLVRVPSIYGAEVVFAVLASDEMPFVVCGLAARRNRDDAVLAATTEACGEQAIVRAGLSDVSSTGAKEGAVAKTRTYAHDRGLADELVRWAEALPLATTAQPVQLDSHVELGQQLDRGAWVDLSTSDSLAFGVHVVRAVVPGLADLDKNSRSTGLAGQANPHPLD